MVAQVIASASAVGAGTDPEVDTSGFDGQSGDLLVGIAMGDPDGTLGDHQGVVGWTLANKSPETANAPRGGIWYLALTGDAPSTVSFSCPTQSTNNGHVLHIRGADSADPLDATPTWGTNGTEVTSHVAPTIDPVGTDSLLICAWAGATTASAIGYTADVPATMTDREAISGTAANWLASKSASQELISGDATGTRTATLPNNKTYCAVSVVIASSAGGSPQSQAIGVATEVEEAQEITLVYRRILVGLGF